MAELTPEDNLKDRQEHLESNLQQVLSNNIGLWREMRNEKLEKLDRLYDKAIERYFLDLETDDENVKRIQQLALQKQALRDAPADSGIAAASDADALKAQWKTDILGTSPYS